MRGQDGGPKTAARGARATSNVVSSTPPLPTAKPGWFSELALHEETERDTRGVVVVSAAWHKGATRRLQPRARPENAAAAAAAVAKMAEALAMFARARARGHPTHLGAHDGQHAFLYIEGEAEGGRKWGRVFHGGGAVIASPLVLPPSRLPNKHTRRSPTNTHPCVGDTGGASGKRRGGEGEQRGRNLLLLEKRRS